MENWRAVVGHEGHYEVSNLGRVRSLDRIVQMSASHKSAAHISVRRGRMLRPGPMVTGHLSVALGRSNSRTVHSLVAEAFMGPRPEGMEVRHLNGDEKDNRAENLAYGTRGDNTRDKKYHAGQVNRMPFEKASALKGRVLAGDNARSLAKEFGVAVSTVYAIKSGRFHVDL